MLLLLALACLERPPTQAPREKVSPAVVAPAPPLPAGALRVRVRSRGGKPSGEACDVPTPTAEGTLAGIAVWVEGTDGAGPPRAEALELRACGLAPAVVVVPPGSALSVRNTGKEACRVTLGTPGEAGALARALPPGATAGMAPAGTGRRIFSCAPRACAGGVVLAGSGGSTGQDGTLTLPSVQVGPRTVRAWHPAWGEGSATVTVAEGATADVTVEMP